MLGSTPIATAIATVTDRSAAPATADSTLSSVTVMVFPPLSKYLLIFIKKFYGISPQQILELQENEPERFHQIKKTLALHQYQLGKKLEDEKHFEQAFVCYYEAAQLGQRDAHAALDNFYHRHIEQKTEENIAWLKTLAEQWQKQGYPGAQAILFRYYRHQHRDEKQSLHWLQRAVAQGDRYAQSIAYRIFSKKSGNIMRYLQQAVDRQFDPYADEQDKSFNALPPLIDFIKLRSAPYVAKEPRLVRFWEEKNTAWVNAQWDSKTTTTTTSGCVPRCALL